MKKIYSITNILFSIFFLFLFIMTIIDMLNKKSVFYLLLAILFLILSIFLPGHFITYDEKSYTYHVYFYKCTILYKDISVISAHGLFESIFGCYYLWAKTKNFAIFLPFCNKKIKLFFKLIKKENPLCNFIL